MLNPTERLEYELSLKDQALGILKQYDTAMANVENLQQFDI